MNNVIPVTYSGQDTNGSFQHPLTGTIILSGIAGKGLNELHVRMATDHASLKVGMDGAVVISYIPGEQGEIEIQVWQVSELHHDFLNWYNAIIAAAQTGDVSLFAAGTMFIQNTIDGTSHTMTGVVPVKVPDKSYSTEAQTVNWVLRCANIANE